MLTFWLFVVAVLQTGVWWNYSDIRRLEYTKPDKYEARIKVLEKWNKAYLYTIGLVLTSITTVYIESLLFT